METEGKTLPMPCSCAGFEDKTSQPPQELAPKVGHTDHTNPTPPVAYIMLTQD